MKKKYFLFTLTGVVGETVGSSVGSCHLVNTKMCNMFRDRAERLGVGFKMLQSIMQAGSPNLLSPTAFDFDDFDR